MELNLTSVGRAAGDLGATPQAIRLASEQLRLRPRLTIDNVPMYSAEDLQRIAQHLSERRGGSPSNIAEGLQA